ncbi:unnamed protein product [Owenia fusiformis]|uniref:Uncharacterized protein n=1 Tax=Owenia fusiformis TaxID=6347 RepID=A0A8J1Y0R0_OWEFU|nr:unnamed protein product [Owenia fusiformis]
MIPVVDFSTYNLRDVTSSPSDEALANLATDVYRAFSEVGFLYLENHGFDLSLIDNYMKTSKTFFNLPAETKKKYLVGTGEGSKDMYHGYILHEHTDATSKAEDLKECFNAYMHWNGEWPEDDSPSFKTENLNIMEKCCELNKRILEVIAIGMKWPRDTFTKHHNNDKVSQNTLRTLNYFPLPKGYTIQPDQTRCGQHSDYGSLTLVFQDNIGGLEVMNRDGDFVPATPIPGTIVVNLGDMMQRWTDDKLKSTIHRVTVPNDTTHAVKGRQSMVFFNCPDSDGMIQSMDPNGGKYKPILCNDYFQMRLAGIKVID